MELYQMITEGVRQGLSETFNAVPEPAQLQVQKTRKEFEGDLTLVVFPLLKLTRKSPESTAELIGSWLDRHCPEIASYNVVKGFLNLKISADFWKQQISKTLESPREDASEQKNAPVYVVEYSSPNTNKPLHLGHIRNNLIGYAVSKILEANGMRVKMVNLVNDRGIHICKSMLAWKNWGGGTTPESAGIKGDKFVGDYYVRFDQAYKEQVRQMMAEGMKQADAEREAPLIRDAQAMLRDWEAGDEAVVDLWRTMNGWVYDGFDQTYRRLGVHFDKIYYESETYQLGRRIVLEGLEKGILHRREDGSVWADLTEEGLDQKLLLRADGTSVYMTQDLGTALQRYEEFSFDKHVYVVGNEQDYHFQVLGIILAKLGYPWASHLEHLSYGMVELPGGKMKSREGTVVDADDLMDEMVDTADAMSQELGKLDGYSHQEKKRILNIIGMGALKYFILKVDPKKNMTFNPVESVDFNGNTGPFIQYTFARIRSVIRKAGETGLKPYVADELEMIDKEIELAKLIYYYPEVVQEAGRELNPALIASHCYELAREFNQFYHDHSILSAETGERRSFRLQLSQLVAETLERGMGLLGIEMPERM